ncbi:MAG: hypothetical protein GY804_15075 [Alphaproteobacteria bacterium]|nr:hypothetical protein [Alphaproteobacteria bacterium]
MLRTRAKERLAISNCIAIKNNNCFQLGWTEKLSNLPNVREFCPTLLTKYISKHDFTKCDLDSYSLSPAYYVLTGRKGAWIYEKNDTAIVICNHPNTEGKALVFPEIGKGGILLNLIKDMPSPPNGFQLARIPADRAKDMRNYLLSKFDSRYASFKIVPEYAQDWLYPTRVICTEGVSAMTGSHFEEVRQKCNKLLNKKEVVSVNLTSDFIKNNKRQIEDLIFRWSANFDNKSGSLEGWISPFRQMLDACGNSSHQQLNGTALYIDGCLEAVNIYEIPVASGLPANSFISFFNSKIKGLSEYNTKDVCQRLREQGIPSLNMGGSESKGLDRYKKKFNPIESKELCTIDVKKSF